MYLRTCRVDFQLDRIRSLAPAGVSFSFRGNDSATVAGGCTGGHELEICGRFRTPGKNLPPRLFCTLPFFGEK